MLERRRISRTRIFASARVSPSQPSLVCACLVRNITLLGALLDFERAAVLPGVFELTFDSGRTLRVCRVAWRTTTQIGVEFSTHRGLNNRPLNTFLRLCHAANSLQRASILPRPQPARRCTSLDKIVSSDANGSLRSLSPNQAQTEPTTNRV